jgi:hypothetical protein
MPCHYHIFRRRLKLTPFSRNLQFLRGLQALSTVTSSYRPFLQSGCGGWCLLYGAALPNSLSSSPKSLALPSGPVLQSVSKVPHCHTTLCSHGLPDVAAAAVMVLPSMHSWHWSARWPVIVVPVLNWPRLEAVWGKEGLAPSILTSALHGGERSRFTPRPLYPRRNSPPYLLNKRLGGPHRRSGRSTEKKISCLCRESKPDSSVV